MLLYGTKIKYTWNTGLRKRANIVLRSLLHFQWFNARLCEGLSDRLDSDIWWAVAYT